MNYTMRKSDNLNEIKIIFSELSKEKSDGQDVQPYLFNFLSVDRYCVYIKRNRRHFYCVCGRIPWKIPFSMQDSDSMTKCFFESKCLQRAKDQYYIIAQKLISHFYLRGAQCPVSNLISSS